MKTLIVVLFVVFSAMWHTTVSVHAATPAVTLQYLGHSAFLLKQGDQSLLIDPHLVNSPVQQQQLSPQYIAVTHNHNDHMGDAAVIANRADSTIIALPGVMSGKVINLQIGVKKEFDFGWILATPAKHPQASVTPAGFIIHFFGVTVYHAGDTYFLPEMEKIAQDNPIDVALLPIGGYYTMNVDEAVKLAKLVAPKLAIPMHYNTFPQISASPEKFKQKAEATGIPVQVLQYGQTLTIQKAME